MTTRYRTVEVLSILLPAGVLGTSVLLAAAPAAALPAAAHGGVAARLQAIREGVSAMASNAVLAPGDRPDIVKAWWGNGHWGWHNGGWGWHNGGWGWHNGGWGWRNGGWHNWHNGWGNGGWRNFWHNW